jgi:hypothetical protein
MRCSNYIIPHYEAPPFIADATISEHATSTCDIGAIGEDTIGGYYRKITGFAEFDGAGVPFCAEAWAAARAAREGRRNLFRLSPPLESLAGLGTD